MSFTRPRDDDQLFFTSKRPHFFKIILGDDVQSEKLAIPRKFVEVYESCLSNSVCLRVPSGAVWQVGLSKRCGRVWFQNGWREFSEYYCLVYGQLLMFELEGCNKFCVIIFDKSASEIKYPVFTHEPEHNGGFSKGSSKRRTTQDEDDDSIEMLGDFSRNCRVRGRSPLPCLHSNKKMKNDSMVQREGPSRHHNGLQLWKEWGVGGASTSTGVAKPKCSLTSKKDAEAFTTGSDFQSEYPYFKVVLRPTYVRKGFGLVIPRAFAVKYLKEMQREVTLYVSDGKAWPATFRHKDRWSYLYSGWHEFLCDNGLRVGDVCCFELIKISEIVLKVTIFRVDLDIYLGQGNESRPKPVSYIRQNCSRYSTRSKTETLHPCKHKSGVEETTSLSRGMSTRLKCPNSDVVELTESLNSKEISQALERASAFQSKRPFFKLVMHPSYVRGGAGFAGVVIPREFARKYLREKRSDVTLCVSDARVWPAKCCYYESKKFRKTLLYYGWRKFVDDNSLKVDDVCVFELIEISELKFKVFIFRAGGDINNQL